MNSNSVKAYVGKSYGGLLLPFGANALKIIILLVAVNNMIACSPSKSITYFSQIADSQLVRLPYLQRPEALIMPDDLLEIKIAGSNEATSQTFNAFGSISIAGTGQGTPVYLVDSHGDIEFPYIGKVKAAGLTRDQLKEKLKQALSVYLKDVLVNVRFNNFRFTVLGEVRLPGSFVSPNDKVSVLEALGQAGDMTQYSIRENVRVIRDSSGHREVGKMDFTRKDVFTSPYYYLRRNDVVYVEASQNKVRSEQFGRVSTLVATFTSIVAIAITLFKK